MNPVRTAIYSSLVASEDVTDLLASPNAVFHRLAPQNQSPPYVVFQKQSGVPSRTFGADRVVENETWAVRAICSGNSATAAEDIAQAADEALDGASVVVNGRSLLYLRRESDIDFGEVEDGVQWHYVGGLYRLMTER